MWENKMNQELQLEVKDKFTTSEGLALRKVT